MLLLLLLLKQTLHDVFVAPFVLFVQPTSCYASRHGFQSGFARTIRAAAVGAIDAVRRMPIR